MSEATQEWTDEQIAKAIGTTMLTRKEATVLMRQIRDDLQAQLTESRRLLAEAGGGEWEDIPDTEYDLWVGYDFPADYRIQRRSGATSGGQQDE